MDQYILEILASAIIFVTYVDRCKCSKGNNFWRTCNKGNVQLPYY